MGMCCQIYLNVRRNNWKKLSSKKIGLTYENCSFPIQKTEAEKLITSIQIRTQLK